MVKKPATNNHLSNFEIGNSVLKGAYWIIQRFSFHYKVIALPTIATVIVVALLALKGDSEEEG